MCTNEKPGIQTFVTVVNFLFQLDELPMSLRNKFTLLNMVCFLNTPFHRSISRFKKYSSSGEIYQSYQNTPLMATHLGYFTQR